MENFYGSLLFYIPFQTLLVFMKESRCLCETIVMQQMIFCVLWDSSENIFGDIYHMDLLIFRETYLYCLILRKKFRKVPHLLLNKIFY